jgi:predicted acylesterase/phospholipase RssA
MFKNKKIGLILLGGSLKGIYGHAGILAGMQELSEFKIQPDVILGASAGAIIGSFYATGLSRASTYQKLITLKTSDFIDLEPRRKLLFEFVFNRAKNFTGFIKGDLLEKYVRESLGDRDDFSKTIIPLYVAATNLDTYELVLFHSGTISDKVRASASIPMMFQPKKIGATNYIDGAVVKQRLPQALLDVEPNLGLIIACNFSHEAVTVDSNYLKSDTLPILEIMRRVFAMHENKNWPDQIGKTKIIYLRPNLRIPVDIFKPNETDARIIFEKAKEFTKVKLVEELKKLDWF